MAAFIKAFEAGAHAIEIDIQRSADGVLVVIHDETVNRTTQGRGYVYSAPFSWLRQLDAGYKFSARFRGERIPTLEEVLSFVESTSLSLNIELKMGKMIYHGIEEQVLAEIKRHGLTNRTTISSFYYPSLLRIKELDEVQPIALLCSKYSPVAPSYAKQFGAEAVHPHWRTVTPSYMNEALQQGIKVRPYTVNDLHVAKVFQTWGIDAIITNHPQRLRSVLGVG
ncbi:hypothetical protein BM613_13320 [Sulfoacidibacillus thermotolerans]|uniref:GP-PDE domain-containing protein n=2 Tax=Sulfoacidibacillus thermotolerans TaxID=1765684 RepID=A0A2U3D2V9_SULT2|nr:hypothetical protein BM613_13320 [Sulfoacidibacillus thermotolerans]